MVVCCLILFQIPNTNRDYGCNVKFEGSFYCNFNATILDCADVIIGDGVLFGPKYVQRLLHIGRY